MSDQTMEKFDVTTIKEKIEVKIRDMVVELIPEEAWKNLVAAEVDRFLGPAPKRTGYDSSHAPKVAKEVIREIVLEKFRASIAVELEKPEYAGTMQWDENSNKDVLNPGKFVQEIVRDNLDQIVALLVKNMMSSFMQQAVDELRRQMEQRIQQGM